jgi:uncharacterized membrane protein YkoI
MRPHVLILLLTFLLASIGGLAQIIQKYMLRPTAPDGAIIVLDERPVVFDTQFSLNLVAASEMDMTLFTVVDPTTNTDATAIEPSENGLSVEQVMEMLAQARPETTIRQVSVKREQGLTIYEVDFSDDFRLKLNAIDGQMLSLEPISDKPSPPPPHQRVEGYITHITLIEAVTIAQQRQPGADFKDAKLEIHSGVLVYKVKFNKGIDVFIDASTGQHLFSKLSEKQYDTSDLPIQREEAIQTAQSMFADAVVYEWKIKFEAGTVVYELKLSNDVKVFIDAITGELIRLE